MAAASAITGIREIDDAGSIGVITAEPHPPYNRPPLSKWLWRGKPLTSIWRKANSSTVTFHQACTARSLDPAAKEVTDGEGTVYHYDKLLLATGSAPRRLPFGDDRIIYFRTLDDYERVRKLAERGDRFAVVGGGFIGSEMAAALAMIGKKVSLIFPDESIGSRMYPTGLARSLDTFFRTRGVNLMPRTRVVGCEARGDGAVLTVTDIDAGVERALRVDGVIAGIGVVPNVELARSAGLKVDDGIVVDSSLRTSHPDIYAAGDVASIYNAALGRYRRVEHADNANNTGGYAGVAMAGRNVSYEYLPFFYSDLWELSYEAVGEVDSRLEMVEEWRTPNEEGAVYYLRDGKVRGALFWNVYGMVGTGRRLIASEAVSSRPGRSRARRVLRASDRIDEPRQEEGAMTASSAVTTEVPTWQLDPAHSSVEFSVKHMMMTTVRGRFKDVQATLTGERDRSEQAGVQASLEVGSIDTGVADRDAHLRGPDFFDAEHFPQITFRSTRVDKAPKKEGDRFQVLGEMVIRDSAMEVKFDCQYEGRGTDPWGKTRAGFSFRTEIDRREWGLKWNQAIETGGVLVGNTVHIEGEVQFVRQGE